MLRKIKYLNVNKNDLSELGKSNTKSQNVNYHYSPSTQIQNKSRSKSQLSSLSQQRNCKKIIKMIESPQLLKFKEQTMSNIQNLQQQYSEYKKNKDPLRYLKKSLYTKGIRHSKIDLTCVGVQTDRYDSIKRQVYQSQTQTKSLTNKFRFCSESIQNQSILINNINSIISSQNSLQINKRKSMKCFMHSQRNKSFIIQQKNRSKINYKHKYKIPSNEPCLTNKSQKVVMINQMSHTILS